MIPVPVARTEWFFSLDWNRPAHFPRGSHGLRLPLDSSGIQLLGLQYTWDNETWMLHVALILFMIRFGRIYR